MAGDSAIERHADSGNLQMPGPAAALRILELMKSESGAEEWALWLKSPLIHAANRGDRDLTAVLLDAGADPFQVDSQGVSILGVASREGHIGVISVITTRYPDTLHQTDADSGYGALHYAAEHNKTESIDALVEAGANVELADVKGSTALHVAAATADCEAAVEALLRHGADKEQEDGHALTPVLVAINGGNEAAVTVLIEAGAILVGGHDDQKVLELAIVGGSINGGANRGGCISIMRTLVARGVKVDLTGSGQTASSAMHWAAWYNHGRAIDFLVEMGADIEAKAYDGTTPFHLASQNAGNLSAIRALAWHGADIHARKTNGDTPLHVAAYNCFFEQSAATVDALLQAGADETMVNAASKTPADILEGRAEAGPYNDEENDPVEQIRKLLANAPADRADRAWARRSYVVMWRAFPRRVRLREPSPSSPNTDSTTNSPKNAALSKTGKGEPSKRGEGSTDSAPNRNAVFDGDLSGAMVRLMELQAELFRAIVEFL